MAVIVSWNPESITYPDTQVLVNSHPKANTNWEETEGFWVRFLVFNCFLKGNYFVKRGTVYLKLRKVKTYPVTNL